MQFLLSCNAVTCGCGKRYLVDPPLNVEMEKRFDEDNEPYYNAHEKTFDFHACCSTVEQVKADIFEELCFCYDEFVVKDCMLSEGAIKFQSLLKERVRCVEAS